ncbi:MAG: MarR family transcriptional regulator, partial [Mycobacteriaceae bacterium]
GFVDRGVDPGDRRRNLVTITRSGRAVHRRLVATQQADALLADAVSDHAGLRAQLIELMASLGGPDTQGPGE